MITVDIKSLGGDTSRLVESLSQKYWFDMQNEIPQLADDTRDFMRQYIQSHTRTGLSMGLLENSIESEVIVGPSQVGFGVGNLSDMATKASYWYIVNFGVTFAGSCTVNVPELYPSIDKGAMRWFKTKNGVPVFAKHTKARTHSVMPMNYIEATDFYLKERIERLLDKYRMLEGTNAGGLGDSSIT